jgi:hypothetical protein
MGRHPLKDSSNKIFASIIVALRRIGAIDYTWPLLFIPPQYTSYHPSQIVQTPPLLL